MISYHQIFRLFIVIALVGFALTVWSNYWLIGLLLASAATAVWLIRHSFRARR